MRDSQPLIPLPLHPPTKKKTKQKTITVTIIPAVCTDSNAAYLESTAGSRELLPQTNEDAASLNKNTTAQS